MKVYEEYFEDSSGCTYSIFHSYDGSHKFLAQNPRGDIIHSELFSSDREAKKFLYEFTSGDVFYTDKGAIMKCVGDGWHMVGTNCRVLVQNRVIVRCLVLDGHGNWATAHVKRWNKEWHRYERIGRVTLASLRSGIRRGTMTIS